MAQPGISPSLRRAIQLGLLCATSALGPLVVAQASNCVHASSELASSSIVPDGAAHQDELHR